MKSLHNHITRRTNIQLQRIVRIQLYKSRKRGHIGSSFSNGLTVIAVNDTINVQDRYISKTYYMDMIDD